MDNIKTVEHQHHHHHHSHSHHSSAQKKKAKKKQMIEYFSQFLIAAFLILMTLAVICEGSVFSSTKIVKSFNNTSYKENAYEEIIVNSKSIAAKNGLEYNIIEEIIDKSQVFSEIDNYIQLLSSCNVEGAKKNIDTERLTESIKERYCDYYKAESGSAIESTITKAASEMAESYKQSISFSDYEKILSFATLAKTAKNSVLLFSLAMIALSAFVIFKNNTNHKTGVLRRYGISIITGGGIVVFISVLIFRFMTKYKPIFVSTEREYLVIMNIIKSLFADVFVTGFVEVILGFACCFLWLLYVKNKIPSIRKK